MNRFLSFIARALEPREREAVLGDLAESPASSLRKIFGLLGLIMRRQALIWTHWQPWMALIGVAGLSGIFLSRMLFLLEGQMFMQIRSLYRHRVPYGNGLSSTEDLLWMFLVTGSIFCWTAVDVAVLRRFSGQGAWIVWPAFFATTLDLMAWSAPTGIFRALVIGPLLWLIAVVLSLKVRWNLTLMARATLFLTCVAALLGVRQSHALEIWSGGAIHNGSWLIPVLPYLFAGWPAIFLFTNLGSSASNGIRRNAAPRASD